MTLAFAALATSMLISRRAQSARRRALVVGLLAAAAMLANTRLIGSGDTRPAAYLPFAIARTGSLSFEVLAQRDPCLVQPDGSVPYWFVRAGDRLASKYPLTTGLLALPVELPSALGAFDICSDDFNDLEKLAAALLSALAVALLFFTSERLVGVRATALATGIYVAGTPVLSVLGQALWQHTGAALGLSFALFGLFALPSGGRRAACVAFGAALVIASRPPDLFLAAGVIAALLAGDRRATLPGRPGHAWLPWLAGAVPLIALCICNWMTLGSPFATGYGAEAGAGWTAWWPEGLAGLLFSPARGLLLLYPVLCFAIAELVRPRGAGAEPGAPSRPRTRELRLLMVGVAAHVALMAKWWGWTGGYSAAPRMLSDALPILGIGLALATHRVLAARTQRRWFIPAAGLSLLCTCLVTYVPPTAGTRERVWSMTAGPWSWRGYPPVGYWQTGKG